MSNNHLHPAFDPVFEAIAALSRLATDTMPLAAIWLEKPLQMAGKRSIRITAGDLVRAETNLLCEGRFWLVDCSPLLPPTHEITECRGTIYSTDLQITVRDLKTNELLTIKL